MPYAPPLSDVQMETLRASALYREPDGKWRRHDNNSRVGWTTVHSLFSRGLLIGSGQSLKDCPFLWPRQAAGRAALREREG
jgi:hypothetical protein